MCFRRRRRAVPRAAPNGRHPVGRSAETTDRTGGEQAAVDRRAGSRRRHPRAGDQRSQATPSAVQARRRIPPIRDCRSCRLWATKPEIPIHGVPGRCPAGVHRDRASRPRQARAAATTAWLDHTPAAAVSALGRAGAHPGPHRRHRRHARLANRPDRRGGGTGRGRAGSTRGPGMGRAAEGDHSGCAAGVVSDLCDCLGEQLQVLVAIQPAGPGVLPAGRAGGGSYPPAPRGAGSSSR